jgi:hypothetical protein
MAIADERIECHMYPDTQSEVPSIYGHTVVLQPRTVVGRMMVPLVTPVKMTLTPAEMTITSSSSTETATQGV